jgi:pyrimidine-specific ribonucleoside hydrolase
MRRVALVMALMLLGTACDGGTTSTTASRPSTTTEVLPATTAPPTTSVFDPRTPVLLDYSPTVSDLGALAFVAVHPDLRLVAVTLPGTGESYCEPGVAHTRGVLVALGLGDVPVACGPEDPITGFNAFPTSWRVASSEMDLPVADPNEERSAPELIVDLVNASDMPVEILAVGPLTNLAVALEDDPSIAESVAGITIMGGAVDVPGNVFRNEVGEWNIWVDPTAADRVFASGADVTLVPLDATNHLPSGRVFWESLDAAAITPASSLVRDAWASNPEWIDNSDGFFYFWDELAAAVLVDESLVTFHERRLVVRDDLRETKGWTEETPDGSPVRVATSADRFAFEQLFLDTLAGEPTDLAYVDATAAESGYFGELAAALGAFQTEVDNAFEGAVEAAGGDLGDSDEEFFALVDQVLPSLLDGAFVDLTETLGAATAPDALLDPHRALVDALGSILQARAEIVSAVATADDFEVLDVYFGPLTEACVALQDAVDMRALDIDLDCF